MVLSQSPFNPLPAMDAHDDDSSAKETAELLAASIFDRPAITLGWVLKQVSSDSMGHFARFRQQCAEADTFMLGQFAFDVPNGATKIHMGTAESVINTLVSHVAPQHLDISVPPPGPRGMNRAELQEKFLIGAHHMIEQNTPIRREIVKHQGLYGVAWLKVEFEGSLWSEFPEPPEDGADDSEYREQLKAFIERRNIQWPIVAEVVNPQEMIWDTASSNPKWVIRSFEVDAEWVKAHFPDWKGIGMGEVVFHEVWTESQVAYVASDIWAMTPKDHGYGGLSWVQFRPQTGLMTIGKKPEHMYRGILHGNFSMLRAQSRLASQFLDIVARDAWPTNDWTGPRGLVEQAQASYKTQPGAHNYIPPGVTKTVSEVAEPTQTVIVAKEMVDQGIEENTVPSVARGQRPTGAASGFHTAVLAGIAALNFGAVVESTQRGLQQMNQIILQIVENVIRDKVTVWAKTEAGSLEASIGPRDIRGHYVSIVKINAVSPEEQERKVRLWSDQWRIGWVDHVTSLRNGGVANPLEVIAQRRAEDFFKDPAILQLLNSEAAKRIPIFQEILAAAEGGTGSTQQVNQIAESILNTQGELQLPNPGNFSAGNQPPRGIGDGARIRATRPVLPGSLEEVLQVGRQIAGPRAGPVQVPGATLGPGGGLA